MRMNETEHPHDTVIDSFSLTRECRDRLRACGESKSALVERLLREHFGMAPRPPVEQRGRWQPGESGRRPKKT